MFGLEWITLDGEHGVWAGALPSALRLGDAQFEALWARHPDVFHKVRLFGRTVGVLRPKAHSALHARGWTTVRGVVEAVSVFSLAKNEWSSNGTTTRKCTGCTIS